MNTITAIKSAVGQGGANDPDDARVVQHLLNDWLGRGKQTVLKVDGVVGPKTIAAITSYQKRKFGQADGRVDSHGVTIAALLADHLTGMMSILNLSRISPYVNRSAITPATLADPAITSAIQKYVSALRQPA